MLSGPQKWTHLSETMTDKLLHSLFKSDWCESILSHASPLASQESPLKTAENLLAYLQTTSMEIWVSFHITSWKNVIL